MDEHRGEQAVDAAVVDAGVDGAQAGVGADEALTLASSVTEGPSTPRTAATGDAGEEAAADQRRRPAMTTPIRAASTLSPIRIRVTYPARPAPPPPKAVRAGRLVRRPSATHSGHWCPTAASFMQSGQIGRSQRVHRTYVSRDGWR